MTLFTNSILLISADKCTTNFSFHHTEAQTADMAIVKALESSGEIKPHLMPVKIFCFNTETRQLTLIENEEGITVKAYKERAEGQACT